jgi:hypothetical protein
MLCPNNAPVASTILKTAQEATVGVWLWCVARILLLRFWRLGGGVGRVVTRIRGTNSVNR